MTQIALRLGQSLRRHSEVLCIIAFILADCFASGQVLQIGTLVALLYVVVPAIRTMLSLSRKEQVIFLKAYVKSPRVLKVGLLLLWIWGVRYLVATTADAALGWFTLSTEVSGGDNVPPSMATAFFFGAAQLAPLAFLVTPVVFYAIACFVSILLRSRLKSTKQDPDLVKQRQRWCGASQFLFLSAFIAGILSISLNVNGPAYMISNWLLASARDANMFVPKDEVPQWPETPPIDSQWELPPESEQYVSHAGMSTAPSLQGVAGPEGPYSDMAFVKPFDAFVLSGFSAVLFVLLLKPVLRLNAFLSSFCWRVVSAFSLQNMIEGFLEALRLPSRSLTFKDAHPIWSNTGRSLLWVCFCYGFMLWLFGFSAGPLGLAIHNWMMASVIDAGFAPSMSAPDWVFQPQLRIFLGSIVALYGTAPIAVTSAMFLPYAMVRKITVNCDGLLFSQGPFLALLGRQFRLWSDLKKLSVKADRKKGRLNATFRLDFQSGGRITFSNQQMSASDIRVLLDGIDQHASTCSVEPQVYDICAELDEAEGDTKVSDGITDTAIKTISAQDFKSTIFVPYVAGESLPGTPIRIIKQLASKPLCAVYLARDVDGRMLTVKQFYLADETDETRALEKIMRREYELLSSLDHPGIAKIVNSFTHEKSTFLLIEHRLGTDMREVVQEHGPRSEGLTIQWAKQLAKIMIYLHGREAPITHRDLTPDNVIVGEDGQLRLIDFGAAREFLEGITGTMLGKHCYVAPEQLRGEATLCSDIYSFGGTLYYLLTGRDPVALSQSSPAKTVACSDDLDRLIQRCTEFEESKRPQSFEEVLQCLNDMGAGFKLKISSVQAEKVPV